MKYSRWSLICDSCDVWHNPHPREFSRARQGVSTVRQSPARTRSSVTSVSTLTRYHLITGVMLLTLHDFVPQNTSVTNCLRNFSSTETLCSDNKFKCDTCCSYQVVHLHHDKGCNLITFRRLTREWESRGYPQFWRYISRGLNMWNNTTDTSR